MFFSSLWDVTSPKPIRCVSLRPIRCFSQAFKIHFSAQNTSHTSSPLWEVTFQHRRKFTLVDLLYKTRAGGSFSQDILGLRGKIKTNTELLIAPDVLKSSTASQRHLHAHDYTFFFPDHHSNKSLLLPPLAPSPSHPQRQGRSGYTFKREICAACLLWDSKVIVLWAVWQPLVSLGFISHTWCSFVEGIGRDFAFLWWDDMSLCLNLFHMTHLTWAVSHRFTWKGQGAVSAEASESRGLLTGKKALLIELGLHKGAVNAPCPFALIDFGARRGAGEAAPVGLGCSTEGLTTFSH